LLQLLCDTSAFAASIFVTATTSAAVHIALVVPVYAFKEFAIPCEEMISIIQLCLFVAPPACIMDTTSPQSFPTL